MPRKRWIPKDQAQTYRLLYRSQDDPLINDDNAGDRALFQLSGHSSSSSNAQSGSEVGPQGLHIADLENEVDLESMRENEGEAAEYGIYFDDTKYDYMQHLKDLGDGGGESHFVDSMGTNVEGKGKGKTMRLEDALREVSLDDHIDAQSQDSGSILDDRFSTFSTTKNRTLERQQNIPDEIAGFQPDMDPRLREALEALEDDAYVDDKDNDDIFGELGLDGKHGELTLDEFEMNYTEDGDGWESDVTEKASAQPKQVALPEFQPSGSTSAADNLIPDAEEASAQDGDWLRDFAKFKRDHGTQKKQPRLPAAESIIAASAANDQAPTLYTLNGTPLRQKKRKGAQTNPSAYSMTSSSLSRTEGQQLLDARFDQVEKMYSVEEGDEIDDMDGNMSLASGLTGLSKQSKMSQLSTTSFANKEAVRTDFDGMMDGFLGDWEKANPGGGKRRGAKGKRGKNGNEKYGLAQLDEVRNELGRGRVRPGMKVV
jgi:protein LTV1